MRLLGKTLILIMITLFSCPFSVLALDAKQQKEFERILNLKMADLSREATVLLEMKYSGEDWEAYSFPPYVYSSESVEIGYKIAVKEPDLLGNPDIAFKESKLGIPCYCFCDSMGHRNLLYCFWKEGKAGGELDDHAAGCNICVGQAMLAFLWKDLGANDQEILKGMETKFERLEKERQKKGHQH